MKIRNLFDAPRDALLRHMSRARKTYYYEDYIRVYPDGMVFDKYGRRRKATRDDLINFANHQRLYRFASQFVRGMVVADIGCGSGHGCRVLKEAGAARVCGADMSNKAIAFARERYGADAAFSVQGITDLHEYRNGQFDVTVCSEVLEHIKEYGREDDALRELRRVTKGGGIIVVQTPNSEMLDHHGFSYNELQALFAAHFSRFALFENALVPYSSKKDTWHARRASGRVGIIVSQDPVRDELILPRGVEPETKKGHAPGTVMLGSRKIDTTMLHNTHSWVAVAEN